MENQLFNLEKIKEITDPIENLQGELKMGAIENNLKTKLKTFFLRENPIISFLTYSGIIFLILITLMFLIAAIFYGS